MSKDSVTKKLLGTGNYSVKMIFAPNRKNYSSAMKVQMEIFEGRNSEGKFECENIADIAQKILTFYKSKTNTDLELRRLARWFIEYLEEAEITPPDFNTLLADMRSTPAEIEARAGNV